MSRRTTRRRQQALNEWRRNGRWTRLWDLGIPHSPKPGVWMIPSDPQREREDFLRQITASAPLEPRQPEFMRGYIGTFEDIRIIPAPHRE